MKDLVKVLLEWISVGPLKGYRTQVIAVIAIGSYYAKVQGWIDQATFETIQGILLPAGLLTAKYSKG